MNPRWLFNENIPLASVAKCRHRGWEVMAIGQSFPGMRDSEVLGLAASDKRWLATFDRDYGELIYRLHYPTPPALVLLRLSRYSPSEPGAWLIQLFEQELLWEGHFHIFDGQTLRRRAFPQQA